MRRLVLTWQDVDKLIDILIPQFETEFDMMVMITRGGLVPGGMLAEAMHLNDIVTASVDFPAEMTASDPNQRLAAWPKFIMFPEDLLIRGRRILVVDDVWGSGRTITAVKNRISGSAGMPISIASRLATPMGSTPSAARLPASPLATSLTVPSPPAATTMSHPRSASSAAQCSASPRLHVVRISGRTP